MTIAKRYVESLKHTDKHNVNGFKKDVEFSATDKYLNEKESYMEFLFKDGSVLAMPFTANTREDGVIKSIDFSTLENVREIARIGW